MGKDTKVYMKYSKRNNSKRNNTVLEDSHEDFEFTDGSGIYSKTDFGKIVEKKEFVKEDINNYLDNTQPNIFMSDDTFNQAFNIFSKMLSTKQFNYDLDESSVTDGSVSSENYSEYSNDNFPANTEPLAAIQDKNNTNFSKNKISNETVKNTNSKCSIIHKKYKLNSENKKKSFRDKYIKQVQSIKPSKCNNPECKKNWLQLNNDYIFYNDVNNNC